MIAPAIIEHIFIGEMQWNTIKGKGVATFIAKAFPAARLFDEARGRLERWVRNALEQELQETAALSYLVAEEMAEREAMLEMIV
jgi:hypothetical protein